MISSKPHVALLASPGMGHLIPVVELAKRLVGHHGLTVTLFAVTPEAHKAEDELLQAATSSWPHLLHTVALSTAVVETSPQQLDPNETVLFNIFAMVRAALPIVRSSMIEMKPKPTAMIVDLFATEAIKMAEELNMRKYVFVASNAMYLAYNLYLPHLEKELDRVEPVYIPGCGPIRGEDLPELISSPNRLGYKEFVRIGLDITTVDGVLINTWQDLEPKTLGSFRNESGLVKPVLEIPVYSVGPLVRTVGPVVGLKTELIEWLDRQPDESVVYVSFGSGGTISTQQMVELAWGLELSHQRFVWVVRPPIDSDDTSASLFKLVHGHVDEVSTYLPNGFLNRTREVGIVVPKWAPQEEILSHRSIAGFVSHCGWNSVLESIVNGVPIITWPLYAEQNMNATMLMDNLEIAVGPEVKPNKGLVKREEIVKMVRRLMVDKEGIGIRKRVKELQKSGKEALSKGGSSYIALSEVAKDCERNLVCEGDVAHSQGDQSQA